jgi:hypothetical protein
MLRYGGGGPSSGSAAVLSGVLERRGIAFRLIFGDF